jgi:hypothetical protein
MPNPDYGEFHKELGNKAKSSPPKKGGKGAGVNEKTANWPGLPGKEGPDRSNGVYKCKTYPTSKGI